MMPGAGWQRQICTQALRRVFPGAARRADFPAEEAARSLCKSGTLQISVHGPGAKGTRKKANDEAVATINY